MQKSLIHCSGWTVYRREQMTETDDMENIKTLTLRLRELKKAISETKKRLPAHSTKPAVMMDLLALEDEYHEILLKIRSLNKNP